MTPKQEAFSRCAEIIIKNLKKRNMEGYFVESSAEAVKLIESLLPKNAVTANGGSATLKESNILNLIQSDSYRYVDRSKAVSDEEVKQIKSQTICADAFFMSTNAITLEGELINTDGAGSRLAFLVYGPDTVYVVAGMNKVVANVEEGISRVRNIASPPNAIRLSRKTPCSLTGHCQNCFSDDCICNHTVITRRGNGTGRIKVILIAEELGF